MLIRVTSAFSEQQHGTWYHMENLLWSPGSPVSIRLGNVITGTTDWYYLGHTHPSGTSYFDVKRCESVGSVEVSIHGHNGHIFLAQPQSAWSWKLIDSVHTFFWQPSGNGIGVTFLLHGQVISNAQDASTLGKSWLSPKSGSWWLQWWHVQVGAFQNIPHSEFFDVLRRLRDCRVSFSYPIYIMYNPTEITRYNN